MATISKQITGGRIDATLSDAGVVEIQLVPDKISFAIIDVEVKGAKVTTATDADKILARILSAAIGEGTMLFNHDVTRITLDVNNVLHEEMYAGKFGKTQGLDLKITS